jgi:hypothetical protein
MEQRSSCRLPVVLKVLIYKAMRGDPTRRGMPVCELPAAVGKVVDLSRGGVLLETDLVGLQSGMCLELDLLLRTAGIDSHAHCRLAVRRGTDRGYALSVDPQCTFSYEILSLLHRRYSESTGAVAVEVRRLAGKNGPWRDAHATSAA